jgi:hypothetical protein
MELLRRGLRMTFYGNCDHSGGIWTVRKNAIDGLDGSAWGNPADQGQNYGFAATAFQGDTPRGGAHVA